LLVLLAFDSVTVAESGVTADESPTRIEKVPVRLASVGRQHRRTTIGNSAIHRFSFLFYLGLLITAKTIPWK
jgi:hypothetical protein